MADDSLTPSEKDLIVGNDGYLHWNGRRYKCALGAAGVTADKREGDGATPLGCFPLRRVLYRPDRLAPPLTSLPVSPLGRQNGWCDDPEDPLYNRQIRQPFSGRFEILWRDDHIYNVIVVLGCNDSPVVPGRGSAIFLHVATPDYRPTNGCVAVALEGLLEILKGSDPRARIWILDRAGLGEDRS